MDAFKIKHLHNLDNIKGHRRDPRDIPLDQLLDLEADFDLDNKFGISDHDYDSVDNISPYIDKQMQDSSELPEDGQYKDEYPEDNMDEQPAMGPYNSEFEDEEGEDFGNPELEGDPMEGEGEGDPNMAGVIRTVKGANLVYKRQAEDNTFTELWVMNVGKDMKRESQIKKAILAGTDVNSQSQQSEDGKQQTQLFSVGNVQFIEISGLPQ